MGQDSRFCLHFTELPTLALNHLVQLLDPGGRLALRETCSKLKDITDACGAPTIYLGSDDFSDATLSSKSRFVLLSKLSDGVRQLDVACCNADLHAEAAEAVQQHVAAGSTAWQSLRQLRCHYQQMILVKALVECSPKHLTAISISGRRGNWQHAGLLLQQLVHLRGLSHLDLALPAQHKLEDYLAQLTQLKSLKLGQAPRSHAPWPLQPLGQHNQAKVDPEFWKHVLCALTQLTSLHLRLPLISISQLDMAPLRQLQQLQVCVGKDNVAELLEEIPSLTALTNLSIDGKVGRRLSFSQHQAMMNQQHQILDLQSIGQLTALRELQLNLHSVQDLASFVPLTACQQLTQLGCAKLMLQLPWRAADLSPGSLAAADAAEERLVAGVLAGKRDLPTQSVLLARPAGGRSGPANIEGMSNVLLPLLPHLREVRVMTLAGKLPLAVLAPCITSISMQGKERLWSHRKGSGDDMDALFAGMQLIQADEVAPPPPGAAVAGGPAAIAAAAAAVGQQMQQGQQLAAALAGQQQPPAGAGAAPQQQQQLAPALAMGPPPPPPPPPPPAPPAPPGFHGGPIASRARAAVTQAERLLGLKQLQAMDLSFTQICGVCSAAGGRGLLENLTSLTVLMRGAGKVRGGVPCMPNLRRLEFYDDGDLKLPGRLSASYDQKEDHQLWVNQTSLTELVLSGSFMLGGFFDGAALLMARKQFTNLKRWVFKDCVNLSIGHVASLLAVKVAPTIVLEGITVLKPSDIRTLIALNPSSDIQLVWSAHVPPSLYGNHHRDRYLYGPGYWGGGWLDDDMFVGNLEPLPPLEEPMPALVEEFNPQPNGPVPGLQPNPNPNADGLNPNPNQGPGGGQNPDAGAGAANPNPNAAAGAGVNNADVQGIAAADVPAGVWLPPWMEVFAGIQGPLPPVAAAAGGGGDDAGAPGAAGANQPPPAAAAGAGQPHQHGEAAAPPVPPAPAAAAGPAAAAAAGPPAGALPHLPALHQALAQMQQAVQAAHQAMAAAGGAAAAAGLPQFVANQAGNVAAGNAAGFNWAQQAVQHIVQQQVAQGPHQQQQPFAGGVIHIAVPGGMQGIADQVAGAIGAAAAAAAAGGQPGQGNMPNWFANAMQHAVQQQQQEGQQAAGAAGGQPGGAANAAAQPPPPPPLPVGPAVPVGGGGPPAGGVGGFQDIQFQFNEGPMFDDDESDFLDDEEDDAMDMWF